MNLPVIDLENEDVIVYISKIWLKHYPSPWFFSALLDQFNTKLI